VREPKSNLGAFIKEWSIQGDSHKIWSMTSSHYLKDAILNLERHLGAKGLELQGKPQTPMNRQLQPWLDTSPLLTPEQANYYMSLIGILRWAVESGQLDIYIDVTLLSLFMA
jgi:hypothetical protein